MLIFVIENRYKHASFQPFHHSLSIPWPSPSVDLSTGRSVVGANVLACLAVGAGSDGGGNAVFTADHDGVGSGCYRIRQGHARTMLGVLTASTTLGMAFNAVFSGDKAGE